MVTLKRPRSGVAGSSSSAYAIGSSSSSSSSSSSLNNRKVSSNCRDSNQTFRSSISNWIAGEPKKRLTVVERELSTTSYAFCPICNASLSVSMMNIHLDSCLGQQKDVEKRAIVIDDEFDCAEKCSTPSFEPIEHKELPGLWLIYNFVTEEEEADLVLKLDTDQTAWHHSSFNGNTLSKSYGVKTQFGPAHIEERIVRANDPEKGELGVPIYLLPYIDRLKKFIRKSSKAFKMPTVLTSFKPNECNANCYLKSEGHSLTPHYDDRFLSGPILMNLSLHGRSRMTYSKGDSDAMHDKVIVDLPRRCLQLVTGDARYKYKHRINVEDVLDDKRISITWRQAGDSNGGLIRGQAADTSSSSIATFLGQT